MPIISCGQLTFVPDDNFEQVLIDLGYVADTCILTYSTIPAVTTDIYSESDRKIMKIINSLARASSRASNEVLFYIYKDGKVEKRIVID
jgi:hypothetical protein